MSMEGCAMACGLLSAFCVILSAYALKKGDWSCMVVTVVFAAIVVMIAGFALAYRYCR